MTLIYQNNQKNFNTSHVSINLIKADLDAKGFSVDCAAMLNNNVDTDTDNTDI